MKENIQVVAFMQSKPGLEDTVREAILNCVEPSQKEEGNISYTAHVDSKNPSLFVVIENWVNAEARNKPLQSLHFKKLGEAVDGKHLLSEHVFHVLQSM